MMTSVRSTQSAASGIYRKLIGDRRGVAAVEFAFVVPIMVLMLAGSFEADQAYEVSRKVTITTVELTDLVTRQSTITSAQMTTILSAASAIAAPFPTANMKIVISEVSTDANNKTTVTWSQTLNGTALVTGTTVSIPAQLVQPNTSLIWGQVSYAFTPGLGYQVIGPLTLSDQIYKSPRLSTSIPYTP
jgi:Flp pilus assembly protein TadG